VDMWSSDQTRAINHSAWVNIDAGRTEVNTRRGCVRMTKYRFAGCSSGTGAHHKGTKTQGCPRSTILRSGHWTPTWAGLSSAGAENGGAR